MTREEELDWLCRLRSEIYVYMPKEWLILMNNALDMAIEALEQEPCEDTISRQAAIEAIFSEPLYKSGMKKRDVDVVIPAIYEKIKSLPSAQAESEDKE